jgi:hypothetical protein
VTLATSSASAKDPAQPVAEQGCRFLRRGQAMTLLGDCTTRTAIVIPDGVTLDGRHHRITARDPEGGAFRGPVVKNGGAEAHVRDLIVRAAELAPICHQGEELAAIALDNCSGSVVDSAVEGVHRRGDACGEGTGIAVHADYGVVPRHVWIVGNHVTQFARSGVRVAGEASADVQLNRVHHGRASAAEAVRITRGASGQVRWNTLGQLAASGASPTAGVRVADTAGPVELSANRIADADVGVAVEGAGGVRVEHNTLVGLGQAAVLLDGRRRPTTDNTVGPNQHEGTPWAVWLRGPEARENELRLERGERLHDETPSGANHVRAR